MNDSTILQHVEECASDCVLPDGATMNVTLKGTAVIEVETNGTVNTGNRYMVNFIDHKTNYCRVFLARTKVKAAEMFKHFLAYFEKRFNCKIHILRTDGGGEYQNVDMFWKQTGVARQVSEPRNQASNGKAERMHRTVFNVARSMLFYCG